MMMYILQKTKLNIKVTFNYTEYGDDAQVNISGDVFEEELMDKLDWYIKQRKNDTNLLF